MSGLQLEPGPYVIRVKVPSGVKLMPHRQPEHRIHTIMPGVFYTGLGDRLNRDKVQAANSSNSLTGDGICWAGPASQSMIASMVSCFGRSASGCTITSPVR